MNKYTNQLIIGIGVFITLIAIAFWSVSIMQPPKAVPEDAPGNVFSAERAMKHLEHIASKPHPIGTEENKAVRDYILEELHKIIETILNDNIELIKESGERSFNKLMGIVMSNTRGKIDGKIIQETLEKLLNVKLSELDLIEE